MPLPCWLTCTRSRSTITDCGKEGGDVGRLRIAVRPRREAREDRASPGSSPSVAAYSFSLTREREGDRRKRRFIGSLQRRKPDRLHEKDTPGLSMFHHLLKHITRFGRSRRQARRLT